LTKVFAFFAVTFWLASRLIGWEALL